MAEPVERLDRRIVIALAPERYSSGVQRSGDVGPVSQAGVSIRFRSESRLLFAVKGITMKALGIHLLVEFGRCNALKLDRMDYLENVMVRAAEVAGATVLKTAFQDFNPQGVSGVVVISESHLTIHTWPEYGYAAVDIFTCGDTVDPWKAAEYLKQEFEAQEMETRDFQRGFPSQSSSGPALYKSPGIEAVQHASCGNTDCQ